MLHKRALSCCQNR